MSVNQSNEQIEKHKSTSTEVFTQLVFDEIKTNIDGGFVMSTEKSGSEIAEALDMWSGIDLLVKPASDERGPIPIAHRVSYGKFPTFTLGKVELEKLKNNIGSESMYPSYTCQSIVQGQVEKELANAAIVSTEKLVEYIKNGEEGEPDHTGNWVTTQDGDYYWETKKDGSKQFCCVSWLDIREWTDKMEIVYLDHAGNVVDNTSYPKLHQRMD